MTKIVLTVWLLDVDYCFGSLKSRYYVNLGFLFSLRLWIFYLIFTWFATGEGKKANRLFLYIIDHKILTKFRMVFLFEIVHCFKMSVPISFQLATTNSFLILARWTMYEYGTLSWIIENNVNCRIGFSCNINYCYLEKESNIQSNLLEVCYSGSVLCWGVLFIYLPC